MLDICTLKLRLEELENEEELLKEKLEEIQYEEIEEIEEIEERLEELECEKYEIESQLE